jgi:hypothetical protein
MHFSQEFEEEVEDEFAEHCEVCGRALAIHEDNVCDDCKRSYNI